IAWAEALQEVVAVLELRLDEAEAELEEAKMANEILRETPRASPPTTPIAGRANGSTSLKSLVDQLQASKIQEARRHDKEKSIQHELAQAREEAAQYGDEVQRVKEENARLRAELQVEKSHTQQMIAQTSELQSLWGEYTTSQQLLEQQLQEMTRREAEERARVEELESLLSETNASPTDDDKVQWLEQAVADAQATAIEERNQAAKLCDENQALHLELKKMQQLLQTTNGASPSTGVDLSSGYNTERASLGGETSKHMRDTCSTLVELRDLVLRMAEHQNSSQSPIAVALGSAHARGLQDYGKGTVPRELLAHSVKTINTTVDQLAHLIGCEGLGSVNMRHKHSHSLSNGMSSSRLSDVWGT
ncbi:unnamed protein product, partial [Ostreobium quekettii]